MYSKILVPVDGSVPSRLGLQEAIKLAHWLGARIGLVHVIDVHPLLTAEVTGASYDTLIDVVQRNGADVLKEAATTVDRAGVPVDSVVLEAGDVSVGECIVRQALDYRAELIVCGTHGRRGLRRLLIGSDAEHIVRSSPIPVLLVRAGDVALEQLGERRPAVTARKESSGRTS